VPLTVRRALRNLPVRLDPDEPALRFVVRLTVAVVAAGALLPAVLGAAHSTNAGAYSIADFRDPRPGRLELQRLEYLGAEIARQVPPGTRAYIAEPDAFWLFRLSELAVMGGLVVSAREADADVVLRRVADQAAPHGVRLVVTPAAK
jgi:hypothetical protein